jgi:hypothetical protein
MNFFHCCSILWKNVRGGGGAKRGPCWVKILYSYDKKTTDYFTLIKVRREVRQGQQLHIPAQGFEPMTGNYGWPSG